jgi:hypothetical protein
MLQQVSDFINRQYKRESLRALGPNSVQKRKFSIEYMFVQKQNG